MGSDRNPVPAEAYNLNLLNTQPNLLPPAGSNQDGRTSDMAPDTVLILTVHSYHDTCGQIHYKRKREVFPFSVIPGLRYAPVPPLAVR